MAMRSTTRRLLTWSPRQPPTAGQAGAGHLTGRVGGVTVRGGILAELRNRGIKDVLFVCCDGLPDAIEATWPKTIVQTCVVHLIRASMKYVSWKDRKKAAAAMWHIYTAVNEAAAKAVLDNLRHDFGMKSPGLVAAWERA